MALQLRVSSKQASEARNVLFMANVGGVGLSTKICLWYGSYKDLEKRTILTSNSQPQYFIFA